MCILPFPVLFVSAGINTQSCAVSLHVVHVQSYPSVPMDLELDYIIKHALWLFQYHVEEFVLTVQIMLKMACQNVTLMILLIPIFIKKSMLTSKGNKGPWKF